MSIKINEKAHIFLRFLCFLFVMLPTAAFSWNQGTHAYIAERLGARAGIDNLSEIWGSGAPDMFNYVFDQALCTGWISDQTHGTYADTFLKVWDAVETRIEAPLAYGFISHNQQWGADFVAHVSGLMKGYENDGYIIIKARQLLNAPLTPADPQQTFGKAFADLGMSQDESLLVAHVLTEYAIDIRLGNEVDPLLGRKLATAARNETGRFPALLIRAYAAEYAAYCFGGDYSTAAGVLAAVEKEHRKDMKFLGKAISQSEPVAARLLAEQLVGILPDFMGGPLPVPDEEAVELMKAAIIKSIALCDDYRAEIEATIEFVDNNLKDHGVTYSIHGNSKNRP